MKLIRGCFTFIGVITFLFLLFLGSGCFLLSLSPPLKAQMTPVVLTSEAVQNLNQKLEVFKTEIEKAVTAGQEKEITLVITEEEVNSKLAEAIAEGKLPFKEVLINFRKDIFLVYGALKPPGVAVKVAAKARGEIVDGKPKLVMEELYFGKLPLPEKIKKSAGDILVSLIKVPGDLRWQVTRIQVADGEILITGITRKK